MSRADLAAAAAHERDGRAQFYPRMVMDREMDADEAQHDWLCWKSITAWLEEPDVHPEFFSWDLTWDHLAEAARKNLARREEALADCKPEHRPALDQRRNAGAAILRRLQRTADFYRTLNDALRSQAADRRAQKEAA